MTRFLLPILLGLATATSAIAQQKRVVASPQLPAAGPYSPAVVSQGLVFCSGQIGLDPQTKQLVKGGFEPELHRTLQNIELLLKETNLTLQDVVTVTVYLKDMSNYSLLNRIYVQYFPRDFPARTAIAVADLPGGANVEITVTAAAKAR